MFDAELAQQVEKLQGIASVQLVPIEAPRLALAG